MATLQDLKAKFTTLTGLVANAATIKSNEKYKEVIGSLSLASKEAWELLITSIKADNINIQDEVSNNVAIEEVLSIFDEIDNDTVNKEDLESKNVNDNVVIPTTASIKLGSEVKITALSKAKLLEISINNNSFVPLPEQLQVLLENHYDTSNKTHRRFIPKSKDTNQLIFTNNEDDNVIRQNDLSIRLINWKDVCLSAVNNAPEFIQEQLLNDPIALYRYLYKGCPIIPNERYIVPSEASLKACKDTITSTINSIKNRIEKLQTQIHFWTSDVSKARDVKVYQSKVRLNKRLLTIFIQLESIFNNIPTKVENLHTIWPKINRHYMYAIKANFAIVKKVSVIKALINETTDSKFLAIIEELTPKVVYSIIYDTTVLNDNNISFRSTDLSTSLNGILSYKIGFTGSAVHNEQRLPLVGESKLIERRKKEKSQTTFGQKLPQINGLGKTLGSLLNIPPTLYKTTRNLYWLYDVSYQGLRLDENGDYIKPTNPSGLIAAIRVSKNADYGYFNIGELFVNKNRQIAYRIPKKSISLLIENLAIEMSEVIEGFTKLGLWYSSIPEPKYYNGVINRSHQRKLKGGQLDLLTDFVLDDLGIKLKRFKKDDDTGSYVISKIEQRHYPHISSFIKDNHETVDAFIDRPLTNSRRVRSSIKDEKIEYLKSTLIESSKQYQDLSSSLDTKDKQLQEKDKQISNQSRKIRELEHKLKLAKKK